MTYPQDPNRGNAQPNPDQFGGYGYPPPAAYPPVGQYPTPGMYPNLPPATNGMAIGSLVASLLGFACVLPGIAGLVLGIIALNQLKTSGERGRGMALAGTIIGGIFTALVLAYLILIFVLNLTDANW